MTLPTDQLCAGCGTPLGSDQRYCLSCGIPRAGTRLPFLDVLHTEAAAAGVIEGGSPPAALLRMPPLTPTRRHAGDWWDGEGGLAVRLRRNTGLFALLGVLLLALLIGLLLGHWAGGGAPNIAQVPTKEVVEIKGLPAAVAAAPAAGASVPGAAAGAASAESSPSSAATTTSPTPRVANPTVSKLATSTGKEHAKEVEKALDNGGGSLSTGGAPPPKATDKSGSGKPIGGGSEVTSIE